MAMQFGTHLKPSTGTGAGVLLFPPAAILRLVEAHPRRPIACRGDGLQFQNIFKNKEDRHWGLSSKSVVPGVVSHAYDTAKEIKRPEVKHSSKKWDVTMFIPYNQVENYGETVDVLKEHVERMVMDKEGKPEDKMALFEILDRLGVAYHFEKEIEQQIAHLFEFFSGKNYGDYDLYTTALHFRLFRQYGHDAPSSVFIKFKDNDDGTFKKALTTDIKGLISLHEATYLKFSNEAILDEANAFATHHLKNVMPLLDSGLQERVARALSRPMHWSIPRLEARHYISFYEKQDSKNELILQFAKLDFNLMQNLHKEEIKEVMKWWESFDTSKFPHVRYGPIVATLWGAGSNLNSRDSFARICAAKGLYLFLMLNDTFDSYATWEEAKKFAEILQLPRWDYEQIGQLHGEGIQVVFNAICKTFEEFDRDIEKQGRPYAVPYAREALGRLGAYYLKQLSHCLGHEMPTFLKSTSIGLYDSGGHPVAAMYLMARESATEEVLKWLMTGPLIIEASGQYVRYTNDLASYKREHDERKHVNTSVDCYMKEYRMSKEEAVATFRELAEDAWMAMNRECVTTTWMPTEFLKASLNYARAAYISYWEGPDGFTYPETGLENDLATLFINPIKLDPL